MKKILKNIQLNNMELKQYIEHVRNHSYMSGVERDRLRVKATAEVFTPTWLVQEMLDELPKEEFEDKTKTFIDPTCGDGQFLSEVIIRKMENGSTLEEALSTTYGVDIMEDNIELTKRRLGGPNPTEEVKKLLDKNIVCADALEYDYMFGEPTERDKVFSKFFGE